MRILVVAAPCVVLGLAACNTPQSNPATGASPQNQSPSHPTQGPSVAQKTTGNTSPKAPPNTPRNTYRNKQASLSPSPKPAILAQGAKQDAPVSARGETRSAEEARGNLAGVDTAKPAIKMGFASPKVQTTSFKVWYPDTTSPAFSTSCAAGASVKRAADGELTAETVLRVLLQGPSESEQSKGLLNPFVAKPPSNKPLSAFFSRAVVNGKHAVIHFSKPARTWLGGPACAQESVKTAIENTLKDTLGITKVDYAIDGTIVVDWDA